MQTINTKQQGFTLIEMIVSLALFSAVITVAVGALLVLVGTNQQLQNEQSVMTNLSFALDSMAREIRTGTHYYCETKNNSNNNVFDPSVDLNTQLASDDVQDCDDGRFPANSQYHGLVFNEGGESITVTGGRILYYYDSNTKEIYRRIGDEDPQSIVSSGINITDAEFFVSGSAPLSDGAAEVDQSVVTIFIKAEDANDPTAKPYQIQTTITQRTLDI